MVPPSSDTTSAEARIRALEEEIARLKERVRVLEARTTQPPEHPVDQQMVRSKVAYDWQQ